MANRIEHTPYAWRVKGGKVILLRQFSLKPLWMLCLYFSVPLAMMPIMAIGLMVAQSGWDGAFPEVLIFLLFGAFMALLVYWFYQGLKSNKSLWLTTRRLPIREGVQLYCVTRGTIISTGMGGTMKGVDERWLVLKRRGSGQIDLVQVYEEPCVREINGALDGISVQ